MQFNEKLPEWQEPGVEPPASKRQNGWQISDKPPAAWLNWFFNRVYKVLQEIRNKFDEMATKEYVDKKSTRIFLSSTPPENPEVGTIWYDDKGEDYDIGDGLVVGNASFDASTNIWFEEI